MPITDYHGKWQLILRQLSPPLQHALNKPGIHVPCPVHGGKDGFRVFKDVALSGGGVCNTCGTFPNGYLLLQWVNSWSKDKTREALSAWVVGNAFSSAANSSHIRSTGYRSQKAGHKSKANQQDNSNVKPTMCVSTSPLLTLTENLPHHAALAWQSVWQESLPLTHAKAKPVQLYFAKRGLSIALSSLQDIRFHPALAYYEERQCIAEYPALVSLVRDVTGQPITVHRTYLTSEGDKAPVLQPKKLMSTHKVGATLGGAIRCLAFLKGKLAVAEGIETALAVSELTQLPCWATVSANGLRHFAIPPAVKCLAIMADIDRSDTGQKAAQALAQRAIKQGIAVTIHYPSYSHLLAFAQQQKSSPKSLDWLDVLNLESAHDLTL